MSNKQHQEWKDANPDAKYVDELLKRVETAMPQPRPETFKVDEIVRYADGPTALMQITGMTVRPGVLGTRYHGLHCMGGRHGVYHDHAVAATEKDLKTWQECAHWRNEPKTRETVYGFPIGSKE